MPEPIKRKHFRNLNNWPRRLSAAERYITLAIHGIDGAAVLQVCLPENANPTEEEIRKHIDDCWNRLMEESF